MSEHITQGVHDMPAEQYFASDAVSNSDLKWITPPYTPAHFRAYKDGQIEREETEAMRIGTLTHRCILEPEKMKGSFVVKPAGMNFTTKEGRAWRDAQTQTIIAQDHADMIARMADAVWKHPQARTLITGSERERSLFVREDSLWLRSRVDCLTNHRSNIIADLKTCELDDLASVETAIYKYGYYRQAAFYLRVAQALGLGKEKFVFIFVEKTPPHCVALYALTDEALEAGNMEVDASLTLLKHCMAEDHWPGREPGINEASLPNWALKELQALV